ncbi:copper resistance protein B [Alloalcanivorax xenomutans]|uniref:copper resistance protein B n=1 Tax=Alloalcanivorax xenomutans TaxID=1094342 RepID=UPI003BAD6598
MKPLEFWRTGLPAGVLPVLLAIMSSTVYAEQGMGHGDMRMQGGKAPDDARDPHAYSDGYTLTEGPYALPAPRVLKLADEHRFQALLGDRLEYDVDNDVGLFDLQGWYGTTYNRLIVKLEGETEKDRLEESQTELLWGHALNAYFDAQLGVRLDHQYDEGTSREWLAIGIQGLAPYWFELDITGYFGESGRTALSLEAEYELLLTQKWILQPRAEASFYGKDDEANGLAGGLTDGGLGLRLRYELSRQFAPYIGVEWERKFGDTAELSRTEGNDVSETRYVAGLRFWF